MQVAHFMGTSVEQAAAVLTAALFEWPRESNSCADKLWAQLILLPDQLQADIVNCAQLPLTVQHCTTSELFHGDLLRIAVTIANRCDGLTLDIACFTSMMRHTSAMARLQSLRLTHDKGSTLGPADAKELCSAIARLTSLTAFTLAVDAHLVMSCVDPPMKLGAALAGLPHLKHLDLATQELDTFKLGRYQHMNLRSSHACTAADLRALQVRRVLLDCCCTAFVCSPCYAHASLAARGFFGCREDARNVVQ